MLIHKTKDFLNDVKSLPIDARKILKKQEDLFASDWLDHRLHVKKLKEFSGVYSFRVTRRFRVLFYFSNGEAVFFSVGHRKDIYSKT